MRQATRDMRQAMDTRHATGNMRGLTHGISACRMSHVACLISFALCAATFAGEPPTPIQCVALDAPGHAAVEGATVTASGGKPGASWTLLDWRGRETGVSGVFDADGRAVIPPMPAGYYAIAGKKQTDLLTPNGVRGEVSRVSGEQIRVSTKSTARPHGDVLATLAVVPLPETEVCSSDTFFGVDTAQSWCAAPGAFDCPWNGGDTFRTVSDLLRLVGVPHVRERMSWSAVKATDDGKRDYGRYLRNAELLRERGISVIDVFHDTAPPVPKLRRLPADLNALFDFCANVGTDFGDGVEAWEFWNEEELDSNVPEPVWDYAAALKAAYLGFKAGRPGLTVLHGALSDGALHPGKAYGRVLYDNDAAKFCDAFNYHTYSPLAQYPSLVAPIHRLQERHGVGDRAIWVTESGTYLDGPGEMEPHTHHKEEVYIFTQGTGYVVVDGTRYPVGPGDVAYIPPDALHSVVNESSDKLAWAAFWWEIIAPRDKNGNPAKEENHAECDVFNDR